MEKEKNASKTEDCVYVDYSDESSGNRKLKAVFAVATGLVIVCVAFFLVYITKPSNKASLHKLAADTFYAKGEFAKARVEYEKSVLADDCAVSAYKGLLLCDFALHNSLAGDDFYRAKEAFTKVRESGKVPQNYEVCLCETYLLAPEIYTTDYDKLIEMLTNGCENMPGNTGLNTALSDAYYLKATQCADAGDFKCAAECYEQVDLLRNSSDCREMAGKAVDGAIDSMLAGHLFEDAFNYAIDKEEYFDGQLETRLNEIAHNGLCYESGKAALGKAYDALKAIYSEYSVSLDYSTNKDVNSADIRLFKENFDDMLMIDGSTDADLCAYSFLKDKYLMTSAGEALGEDYSGLGVGIYTYGDKTKGANGKDVISYYFFIGNYKDGKRDGYGIAYITSSQTSYRVFEGYYKDDKPEGFGILYINDRFDYTTISRSKTVMAGILKGGYFDGTVQEAVYLNDFPDDDFCGTFTAKEGVPDTIPDETLFYRVDRKPDNSEPLYAVLMSSLYGYASYVPMYYAQDSRLGAVGYDF